MSGEDERRESSGNTSGESSEDPFEDFDPDRKREGDPFEDLGDGPEASAGVADSAHSRGAVDSGDTPPGEDRLDDHPFSDPDSGARRRRTEVDAEDPFADMDAVPGEDPFESGEWSVEDVDESVWEDLSTSMADESTTEQEGGRRVSAVNKHSFCEQCEYFTGPPEIACRHDGTEILEFLDMETVEVVNCPVVEERERLEEAGTRG